MATQRDLAHYLQEYGPWCCGAGRFPHVVDPEELEAVAGTVLCRVCARRRGVTVSAGSGSSP